MVQGRMKSAGKSCSSPDVCVNINININCTEALCWVQQDAHMSMFSVPVPSLFLWKWQQLWPSSNTQCGAWLLLSVQLYIQFCQVYFDRHVLFEDQPHTKHDILLEKEESVWRSLVTHVCPRSKFCTWLSRFLPVFNRDASLGG